MHQSMSGLVFQHALGDAAGTENIILKTEQQCWTEKIEFHKCENSNTNQIDCSSQRLQEFKPFVSTGF